MKERERDRQLALFCLPDFSLFYSPVPLISLSLWADAAASGRRKWHYKNRHHQDNVSAHKWIRPPLAPVSLSLSPAYLSLSLA